MSLYNDLMDNNEELGKVKESRVQIYDYDCTYREKYDSIVERVQNLEKENIEWSSELTDHTKERDKLKESVDVQTQLSEAYKLVNEL